MNKQSPAAGAQKKFDFSPPRARPFLAHVPFEIDSYEEGVARFFQRRTGLDYYATIDRIVEFVINTRRGRVVDLVTDTGVLALRLAGRKAFSGRVYSFDSNITLLERARQRASHLKVGDAIDFRQSEDGRIPVADGFAEIVVSVFDFHRHAAEQFLAETRRLLAPEGHLLLAELIERRSARNRLEREWRRFRLRYLEKKPAEADAVYYDREEMIAMVFRAGFRQVILQGLKAPESRDDGVFTLIAATR